MARRQSKKCKLFLVVEFADEEAIQQPLALNDSDGLPPGGILDWPDNRFLVTVFTSRKQVQDTINRTEHYRLAFGSHLAPEKRFCRIVPIRLMREACSENDIAS